MQIKYPYAAGGGGGGSGVDTLAPVGASPNPNAASITGTTLTLQPASGTQPGVVTTGTQGFAGFKTFSSGIQTGGDYLMPGGQAIASGTGSPQSVYTRSVGSLFLRTDGSTGTTLYIKESGAGNTGWTAVGAGGGTATFNRLYQTAPGSTGVSNVSNTATTLATYTMPGGTLTSGKTIVIRAAGWTTINGNNKFMQLKFGATALDDFRFAGTAAANNGYWVMTAEVNYQSGTSQYSFFEGLIRPSDVSGTPTMTGSCFKTTPAETLASNVAITCVGTGGASNDITMHQFSVDIVG